MIRFAYFALISALVGAAFWFAAYAVKSENARRQWEYDDRPDDSKPDFFRMRVRFLVSYLLCMGGWIGFWLLIISCFPPQR